MDISASPSYRSSASNNWWVYLLGGIILFALGLYAFINPGSAFLGLTIYFAAVILFNGIGNVIFALSNRGRLQGWGWLLALGLAEAVFGLYLFSAPVAAAATLAYFIGFWVLLRSGSTIANAFVLRRLHYRNWGWNLALGVLGIVLGFMILANPAIGALGATVWVAIALVVLGVALMVLGWRLRSASAHAV
jgi:uncharacterized membrane protein HdeD (DUF308 family)